MCFIIIAINNSENNNVIPILIDRYPSGGIARQEKNSIEFQNKEYENKVAIIVEKTTPLTAEQLGIINTQEYIAHCREKEEQRSFLLKTLHKPKYWNHSFYVF